MATLDNHTPVHAYTSDSFYVYICYVLKMHKIL